VVKKVGAVAKEKPKFMHETLRSAENITGEAVRAVEEGNLKRLGSLMNENQELLSQVKASHKRLNLLIEAARGGGALGAKLTGGGGGGCMIALTEPNRLTMVAKAIKEVGGEAYTVEMDIKGAHSWRAT